MSNRDQKELFYRLHRDVAVIITACFLCTIFYIFPRFSQVDSHRDLINEVYIVELDTIPLLSKLPLKIPYPRIPIEAENIELFPVDELVYRIDYAYEMPLSTGHKNDSTSLDFINILYNEDEVDTPPELLFYQEPEYPSIARLTGVEGRILVKILINHKGIVERAEPGSGHPFLLEPARKAAYSCRFSPAKVRGIPVSVKTTLPVSFKLR
ncbi:MAG: hypothetical protein Kow00108_24220 [Calditrichia bacterium]